MAKFEGGAFRKGMDIGYHVAPSLKLFLTQKEKSMFEHPELNSQLNAFHFAHHKCVSVIESCRTIEQVKVAERYTEIFWRRAARLADQLGFDLGLGLKLTLEELLLQKYSDLGFNWEDGEI